jgi:hypothetical protein
MLRMESLSLRFARQKANDHLSRRANHWQLSLAGAIAPRPPSMCPVFQAAQPQPVWPSLSSHQESWLYEDML